ncbi:mechanosensitive ion channel family protein [Robiginitalea aurantiaca]|uniref:Mechanosensitive ion channel n=1 Tax=Robiginitalea aurantiaca TaxID=3056915 RepID=A0ABT7WD42_9FLAO|nr:mechanosensitive ion channel domain-containing protein [Robiginitalea aurantiaca]MDM9630841.1 mechanosensitive ion channel [Robiginitalea aurantiaca]
MMQENSNEVNDFIESDLWESISEFLNTGIHLGEGDKGFHLTFGILIMVSLSLIATKYLMGWTRKLITRRMDRDDKMKFITIFKYVKYLIYMVVILLTMSSAGIDITLLITASAALFVGIGLALQELFQDIMGGILIVVDKTLRVGDIVEVDGRVGKILEIRLRTTLAHTRDDKVMVIPNHKFMNDTVFNYTQNHRLTRESIKVGVAYGSDVKLVSRLLLEALEGEEGILKHTEPFVMFDDFGDSALMFSVHFYIDDAFMELRLKSRIRYRIDALFRKNGVKIPFPQRDVHFYSHTPLTIDRDTEPDGSGQSN